MFGPDGSTSSDFTSSEFRSSNQLGPIGQAGSRPRPFHTPLFRLLGRDRDVHGVVVRRDGRPVAGAHVQILHHPWRHQDLWTHDGWSEERLGPETWTSSDGSFALRIRQHQLVEVRVTTAGCAVREWSMIQAGERVRLVVDAPVRLVVRTLTPNADAHQAQPRQSLPSPSQPVSEPTGDEKGDVDTDEKADGNAHQSDYVFPAESHWHS